MADDDISGGFADTVDPRIAEYLRYAGASNMSIQPGRAIGALAAQDAYAPPPPPAPTPPPPPEDSYDPFAAEKFVPQPIADAMPGVAQADYAKLMSGRSADNSPVLYPISAMPGGGLTQQDMDRAMGVGMAFSGRRPRRPRMWRRRSARSLIRLAAAATGSFAISKASR